MNRSSSAIWIPPRKRSPGLRECAPVCGRVQMKLGVASRHFVGGMGWSLRALVKNGGVSTESRGVTVKAGLRRTRLSSL